MTNCERDTTPLSRAMEKMLLGEGVQSGEVKLVYNALSKINWDVDTRVNVCIGLELKNKSGSTDTSHERNVFSEIKKRMTKMRFTSDLVTNEAADNLTKILTYLQNGLWDSEEDHIPKY